MQLGVMDGVSQQEQGVSRARVQGCRTAHAATVELVLSAARGCTDWGKLPVCLARVLFSSLAQYWRAVLLGMLRSDANDANESRC
jgi:hypothetical protein